MTPQDMCRMAARSLFAEIGAWGERCALIGGITPGLLMPEPPPGLPRHVGTTDIDLAVHVAMTGGEPHVYRTLKHNLGALGLTQSADRSFEWTRSVEGARLVVELFVPVDDASRAGKIVKKPVDDGGSSLTALGLYGLNYIERDIETIEDEGPLLDGQGTKRVSIRVCGPAMLLALKAWAIADRVKSKDGYDIVWMVRAWGPSRLAARFRDARLHETEFGREALLRLESNFGSQQGTGPVGWAAELGVLGEQSALERRDAAASVKEFLRRVRQDDHRQGPGLATDPSDRR